MSSTPTPTPADTQGDGKSTASSNLPLSATARASALLASLKSSLQSSSSSSSTTSTSIPSSSSLHQQQQKLQLQTSSSSSTTTAPTTAASTSSTSTSASAYLRRHSLYSSLDDKVIFDIGSTLIKFGFSGEHIPRATLPISTPIYGSTVSHGFGEHALITGRRIIQLYDLDLSETQAQTIRPILTKMLQSIYHKNLLISPKTKKVVLVENVLHPLALKKLLLEILFDVFQVPSVTFYPSHLSALATTGSPNGLVVDIGWLETSAMPVYEFRPLIHFSKSLPMGGKAVMKRLQLLLLNHGSLVFKRYNMDADKQVASPTKTTMATGDEEAKLSISFIKQYFSMELLQDIMARCLFTSPHAPLQNTRRARSVIVDENMEEVNNELGEKSGLKQEYKILRSSANSVVYPLALGGSDAWLKHADVEVKPNEKISLLGIRVPGWVREWTTEVLFEGDEDGFSIIDCILEPILKLPVDIRVDIAQTTLLTGGLLCIPGLRQRILNTIDTLANPNSLPQTPSKTHSPLSSSPIRTASTEPPSSPSPVSSPILGLHSHPKTILDASKVFQSNRYALTPIISRMKFSTSIFPPNCVSWCGASILSSIKNLKSGGMWKEMTKEEWSDIVKEGCGLQDWGEIGNEECEA